MTTDETDLKAAVRERYGQHATSGTSCCGPGAGSPTPCCAPPAGPTGSEQLGYDKSDLTQIPSGADLGLGCGNPLAIMALHEGATVLDLGSGAGIDCFVAANRVGPSGHVIGVDMTPEMVERARRNAEQGGYSQVEFRLGELEHLPVADATVDAVISNCVINLVPDKGQAFREAFRVLKPGGRLSVSDIVLLGDIPDQLRDSAEAYVACLAGAIDRDAYLELLVQAGFEDVAVEDQQRFALDDVLSQDLAAEIGRHTGLDAVEIERAASAFASVRVRATKPGAGGGS